MCWAALRQSAPVVTTCNKLFTAEDDTDAKSDESKEIGI